MKQFGASAFAKLFIALLVIALLTGCAYYGVFGVAFTVVGADDWAGAVLGIAMENHTQQITNYYWDMESYKDVKEKDLPEWAKERIAEFETAFNPENTNFRYAVLDEEGNQLSGNYAGEAYIARSYDWEQRFVGTDIERQRLNAYDNRYHQYYDYDNDVNLENGHDRFPVEEYHELPKEYIDCRHDELGYLYDADDNIVARVENYREVFAAVLSNVRPDEFYVDGIDGDGTRFYTISPDEGYPREFAYYNDYGKIFDREFNYLTTFDEYYDGAYDGTVYVESTPTPNPIPTARPQVGTTSSGGVKPEITKLNTVMTSEEYNELRDACYEEISVRGYILKEMPVEDTYSALYARVLEYASVKDEYLDSAIGLGAAGLILLVILLFLAGKRNEEGLYEEAGLGRLPWDVWIVVICCLAVGAFGAVFIAAQLTEEAFQYNGLEINIEFIDLAIKGCVAAAAICLTVLVGTLHSLATRVRVKGWWRNCLCWKILVFCWKWCVKILKWCWKLWKRIWNGFKSVVKSIPLVWKAVVVLGVLWIVETVYIAANVWSSWAVAGIMWNIVKVLVCIIICLMLKRLQQGARTIADGNLDHRIDTKNLYGDFKEHAECLNRIGDGLSRSVDAQLRSERMKTELITNVSHDLKTPLTSIVNYVDLLKKEELTGTAAEYVEVLDRQSARLKKLTEDLVEASKASTGNLNVNVERVSVTELIEQASAEYALRLGENGLQTIVRQPDEEVMVWADGKYVWRILDNLLSNVCKYAMPNTRVYLELRKEEDTAVLSVKNMSRESLNISAEELMERFVRGDSSRTSEGSGLGLSIAQSLAKLMGGEVRVTIDGDLFKADVVLPLAK